MKRPFGPYPVEESLVPPYVLPDPLLLADGSRVTSAAQWMNAQRGNILSLFKKYEFGEILPRPDSMRFELLTEKDGALDGTAIRREIRIHLAMNSGKHHSFDLLLYLPKTAEKKPAPAFLGLNFKGNHAASDEPDVAPTGPERSPGAVAETRGCQAGRWCFREAVRRGFASATVCYHDIHRDKTGFTGSSVFGLFFDEPGFASISKRYSVIGAWAWGLSRALDCLEAEPAVNPSAVAIHGHSRLGKTALWAGAVDPRFALVISNCSGCGGGALHRRKFGENLSQHFKAHTDSGTPCWFVDELENYIWREEELPMDHHELVALAAPRPVCLGTATLDVMADPESEFLACRNASPVYRLFGSEGLTAGKMPPPDVDITGGISFHCHTGPHDQTPRDWEHYFALADRFLS